MTLSQAIIIATSYDLHCKYSELYQAHHIHFLGAGFYLAEKRTKLNKAAPLLKTMAPGAFRKLCLKHRPDFSSLAAKKFFRTALDSGKYVQRKTIGIHSVQWYPQFNLLTIMSDGIPQARFVASKDFKTIFFAYSSNPKLQYLGEPNSIPHIFPAREFKKWLGHIPI